MHLILLPAYFWPSSINNMLVGNYAQWARRVFMEALFASFPFTTTHLQNEGVSAGEL